MIQKEKLNQSIVTLIFRFKKILFLKRHMEEHSLPKRLKCHYCKAKFRSNRALNYHKGKHNTNVPPKLKVLIAQKPSIRKSTSEIDCKNYQCYLCNKMYVNFVSFSVSKISNKITPFIFRLRHSSVKEHMAIHTLPKALKCQYCTARFRTQRYLTQHNRIHIDFSCDVCHKKCTSGRTLRVSLMKLKAQCIGSF